VAIERFNTNSHRATPNADGTYTLTFNPEGEATNALDVAENWNGLLRCYLPMSAEEVLEFGEGLVANHPIVPLN
jgi:hypothetical protein